jgi:hypothetical protein
VVAAGDEIDAAGKHLFGGLRRQTETARGVFAVGDAGVDVVLLASERNAALERLAPGRTDDVSDQQQREGRVF